MPTELYHVNSGFLSWSVVIAVSLVAALWDAAQHRIPNRLTGPVWLGGLIAGVCTAGLTGLGSGLVGSVLLSGPFLVLFVFAGGGAGDASLTAAIGAWLGVSNSLLVLVAVCVAGVVVGLAFALARGRFLVVMARTGLTLRAFVLRAVGVRGALQIRVHHEPAARTDPHTFPYAIAVFAGVVAAAGVTLWHG